MDCRFAALFLCHYLVFLSDSSILLASANKLSLPQEHAAKVMIFFNIVSTLLTSNRQMTFFYPLGIATSLNAACLRKDRISRTSD